MNSPPEQSASLPFDSFADTGSLPLNPALINESLNELWERSQSETHGDAAYTRVTLADLVIVTDRVSQPRAEKLSMQFARERPSRSIMLLVEDTPEETDIRAEIGIACSMTSEGSDMLCWEKINVRLPRAKLEAAPNIIRSLTSGVNLLVIVDLLPCLIGESVNTALYELADYVFFDSRINRRKLAAKIQAGRGSLDRLFDLEYERDHPLREAIKLAFDDERLCESLSELEKVIIRPGSSMVRAMYICGWLSAKLKLSYARHESRRSLVFNAAGEQQVDVEVRAAGKQGSGSRRNAVQFYFGLDRKDCLEIRHARPGQNGDHAGASDRYEILWNGAPRAVSPHGGLDESEYMLRRTSDTYRRGDYTESLRRTLTLLFAGSRDPSGEAVVSVLRSGNPAMVTQKAADLFVEIMRESVIRNGRFTVALAGGGTPVNVYRRLSESVYATCTEWAETLFFFGDERAVPPTHEDSNYLMARLNLFERLSVNPDKVFRMGGELDDLGAAAREYQQTIERSLRDKSPSGYPAFDLILLGMGPDGHTASVFPDYPEDEVGAEDLVADVYVGSKQAHRLTLTPTLINAARHILFLVTGEEKSQAVFETVVDHSTPAARIQPESGRVIFLVDAAAASRLDMSPLANLP